MYIGAKKGAKPPKEEPAGDMESARDAAASGIIRALGLSGANSAALKKALSAFVAACDKE